MTAFFILIFLFGIILFVERRLLRIGKYTPVVLLIAPLLVVIILAYITASYTNFILPQNNALTIIIYGTISFWFGGLLITMFMKPLVKTQDRNLQLGNVPMIAMYITGFVFVLIMMMSLRSLLANRSLLAIEKSEFAMNGVEAHIGGIIMGYLIFFMVVFWEKYVKKNRYLCLFFVVAILFLKLASGIRGNVILPFIGALIYLLSKDYIRTSPRFVLFSSLGIVIIFMLPTLVFLQDASSEYLISYFVFYMCAGVLGLYGYMDQQYVAIGANPDILLTFFINLKVKIMGYGQYVDAISPVFAPVTTPDAQFSFASNVYTLIGEVFINAGMVIGSIYMLFLGAYCYLLYFFRGRSMMLLLLYSFVGACLVLGVFSQYTFTPYFYEIQVLFILLHFLSKYKLVK